MGRLRLDDQITCPREGCDAQAMVRRGTKPTGGRFGDWNIICADGHIGAGNQKSSGKIHSRQPSLQGIRDKIRSRG